MVFAWKFMSTIILFSEVLATTSYVQDPSYSSDYIYSTYEKKDFRKAFIDKRKQNRVTARRVKMLDKYLLNNSVFLDGILHHKIDKKHADLALVNRIEKAFRNLIGLKEVKFTFKRDQFWRTWRKVNFTNGERIISYKSQGSVNCSTSASCETGSYWVIEENPPCPFEIVSVISNEELCAINITNNTNVEKSCPSIIQFGDITIMCVNPIDTKWRVQKEYTRMIPEQYPAILCGGRDYCEISTFYLITRDYVSFRIINATNHIIYSRIMKNGKKNYACATDCGMINPITKTVSKTDKPFVVDLINNQTKNKRHNIDTKKIESSLNENPVYKQLNSEKFEHIINEYDHFYNLHHNHINSRHHIHNPSCSSLKISKDISDDENESQTVSF